MRNKLKPGQTVINITSDLNWKPGQVCVIHNEVHDNLYYVTPLSETNGYINPYRDIKSLVPSNKFFRRLYGIDEK